MKQTSISLLSLLLSLVGPNVSHLYAQSDIQLNFDQGSVFYPEKEEHRTPLILTYEQTNFDDWGMTYYFIDLGFQSGHLSSVYTELSREFPVYKALAFHVEINGGLFPGDYWNAAYLTGFSYSWSSKTRPAFLSLSLLYKYIDPEFHADDFQTNNAQLTAVWSLSTKNESITASGYADFWTEDSNGSKFKLLTRPQFWFNLKHIKAFHCKAPVSLGLQVELSSGLMVAETETEAGTFFNPAIGLKWIF